jgi:hypothetical protein
MSEKAIKSYGMKPVARFRIAGNSFQIDITDPALALKERCIYAFLVEDEIFRVGSSKAKLAIRLGAWRRDVSAALQGRRSPTPQKEADGWREALSSDEGTIFARPGALVKTPIGEISAYLDEECVLIARHRPRFCRR